MNPKDYRFIVIITHEFDYVNVHYKFITKRGKKNLVGFNIDPSKIIKIDMKCSYVLANTVYTETAKWSIITAWIWYARWNGFGKRSLNFRIITAWI